MTAIANITVKKNDGTTDVIYTAKQPSSGDGTAAIWRADSVGTAQSHRPEFRLTGKQGKTSDWRSMRSTYQYPQIATNSTTTLTSVVEKASAATSWDFPKSMSQADINEFVSQYANLIVSTLIKDCVKDGFSAT